MQSKATTVEQYLKELPPDRKEAISRLRQEILKNLPNGFEEVMSYGMLGYVVPKTIYPDGYHCDPTLPLPFINLASQKNIIAVYHMGMYADQKLLAWFQKEYSKRVTTKPDTGKSCIRFKKPEAIPYELIGELAGKLTVDDWISLYETKFKKAAPVK